MKFFKFLILVCFCLLSFEAVSSESKDVKIVDHYRSETFYTPVTQKVCKEVLSGGDKTGDTVKGAVIGGAIGNAIGKDTEATTAGIIIGGIIGHSSSNQTPRYVTECEYVTHHNKSTREVYSHSTITFVENGVTYTVNFQK